MILLGAVGVFLGAFVLLWWAFERDTEWHIDRDEYESPLWRVKR